MATKKSKKADKPGLTRKERQQIRKMITAASTFSIDELAAAIREQPKGKLAIQVMVESLWDKFRAEMRIEPPVRRLEMSLKEWKEEEAAYMRWTHQMKSAAAFWYLCGMMHEQNQRQLLDILDSSKDNDAAAETDTK